PHRGAGLEPTEAGGEVGGEPGPVLPDRGDVERDGVGARAAVDDLAGVLVDAVVDHVVTGPAVHGAGVTPVVAEQVVAVLALEHVLAAEGEELVVTGATVEPVGGVVRRALVVVAEGVLAAGTHERVGTRAALEDVA